MNLNPIDVAVVTCLNEEFEKGDQRLQSKYGDDWRDHIGEILTNYLNFLSKSSGLSFLVPDTINSTPIS